MIHMLQSLTKSSCEHLEQQKMVLFFACSSTVFAAHSMIIQYIHDTMQHNCNKKGHRREQTKKSQRCTKDNRKNMNFNHFSPIYNCVVIIADKNANKNI